MKINLINDLPEEKKTNEIRTLGDCGLGEFIKLGDREYVVLGHDNDTTAIITNNSVTVMSYGSNSNYIDSQVREFCNGEFYEELADAVGKENIIPHKVNLMCNDGTNKRMYCEDNVSILTDDKYRQYREYITAEDKSFWSATRASTIREDVKDNVGIFEAIGSVHNIPFWYNSGVRPFCILNSSVIIS